MTQREGLFSYGIGEVDGLSQSDDNQGVMIFDGGYAQYWERPTNHEKVAIKWRFLFLSV